MNAEEKIMDMLRQCQDAQPAERLAKKYGQSNSMKAIRLNQEYQEHRRDILEPLSIETLNHALAALTTEIRTHYQNNGKCPNGVEKEKRTKRSKCVTCSHLAAIEKEHHERM